MTILKKKQKSASAAELLAQSEAVHADMLTAKANEATLLNSEGDPDELKKQIAEVRALYDILTIKFKGFRTAYIKTAIAELHEAKALTDTDIVKARNERQAKKKSLMKFLCKEWKEKTAKEIVRAHRDKSKTYRNLRFAAGDLADKSASLHRQIVALQEQAIKEGLTI